MSDTLLMLLGFFVGVVVVGPPFLVLFAKYLDWCVANMWKK